MFVAVEVERSQESTLMFGANERVSNQMYSGSIRDLLGSKQSWLMLIGGVLLFPSFLGCDLGTYNKRFKERTALLDEQSELASLLETGAYQPLALPDGTETNVQILQPKGFVSGGMAVYHPNQIRAEPLRAIPPGIQLPGFSATYERITPDPEGNQIGYYVYHGVVPNSEMSFDEVKEAIREKMDQVFAENQARWEPVELLSPDGNTTNWERLKFIATQDFVEFKPEATDPTFRKLDGHLIIGVQELDGKTVIVGCRVAAQLNDQLQFLKAMEASMGSVRTGT